jgi:hypothetical protein
MKKVKFFGLLMLSAAIFTGCGGGSSVSNIELFPVKSGNSFEYINRKGEIVINPQFDRATVFRNGVALVRPEGSEDWGYLNPKGEFVSEQRYKYATTFSEGLAWATVVDQAPAAITPKGAVRFSLKEAMTVRNFHDGLAAFYDINNRWGFVDTKGNVKIAPKFLITVGDFSGGLCAAIDSATGKWGYINTKGEFTINAQFDNAKKFVNGLAVVELDRKYGAIDKKGKYVINPQFTEMQSDGDLFLVEQDDKYGWCDKTGKFVINPQFRHCYGFGGAAFAPVRNRNEDWGYINKKGVFTVNPQFAAAIPFSGDLAGVRSGDRWGLIDKTGKYVVNPQFTDAANDILHYLAGESAFDAAQSDYFNAEDVAAAFDFNAPEGLTAASNYWEIVGKFGVKQTSFSKYSNNNTIIRDKKVGTKVTYSFTVNGFPYDKKVSSGWWATTTYTFNGDYKPKSYSYSIKTDAHTDEVWALFDKKLSENHTAVHDESWAGYTNDVQTVSIDVNNPYINVSIELKKPTAAADSTTVQ